MSNSGGERSRVVQQGSRIGGDRVPQGTSQRRATTSRRLGATEHANELKDLVVGYAKQETVGPLRNLGRYLGFGLSGSIALGSGILFLLLALLRGLQRITLLNNPEKFDGGRFAWAPYVIVMIVGIAIAIFFLRTLMNLSKKGRS